MARGRAKLKQATLVVAPDLIALTTAEAMAIADRLNLNLTDPDDRPLSDPAGVVIAQRPIAGMKVVRHGAIAVWTTNR